MIFFSVYNTCTLLYNAISDSKEILCGVPQGSILGPILFILYINGICNISEIMTFVLFADDTNILCKHENYLCVIW